MFSKLIPAGVRRYLSMNKRQRKHEVRMTLWYIPLLYVAAAIAVSLLTMLFDNIFNLASRTTLFVVGFETTRLLVGTLISGILLLSAFSLNILLVILTTFSSQFSPRMLKDFVANRQTQHLVGMFNGSFIYVLLMFLFISRKADSEFVVVPVVTVLLTFLTAIGFIFFINHSIAWMQVHNVTAYMKNRSEAIFTHSLSEEMEKQKVKEAGDLKEQYASEKKFVRAAESGYIQLVDFKGLIKKAEEDDIIIEITEKIGDFILEGNTLFSYWGESVGEVDEESYRKLISISHRGTEIQDFNSSMSKLAEVAIKAIGSNDPRSAISAVHQLAELMQTIDKSFIYTPYLADENKQVRVIIQVQHFQHFLYRGMGMIRHYAPANFPVITEIISSLRLLADTTDPVRHQEIWEFAEETIVNVSQSIVYRIDRELLLEALQGLSQITGNEKEYQRLENEIAGNA